MRVNYTNRIEEQMNGKKHPVTFQLFPEPQLICDERRECGLLKPAEYNEQSKYLGALHIILELSRTVAKISAQTLISESR